MDANCCNSLRNKMHSYRLQSVRRIRLFPQYVLFLSILLWQPCQAFFATEFAPIRRGLNRGTQRCFRHVLSMKDNDGKDHSIENTPTSLKARPRHNTARMGRREVAIDGLAAAASLWLPSSCMAQTPPDILEVPPGMRRLILCRHGQTELNRLGKIQGSRVDPPLNENGTKQARLLSNALTSAPLCFVASSTLKRAQQTAGAVCERHPGVCTVTSGSLNEVDFGSVDGLDLETARRNTNKTYREWVNGNLSARSPGGESFLDLEKRQKEAVLLFLARCGEGRACLAVSHSSYLRIMFSTLLGWPLEKSKAQTLQNACMNILDVDNDGTVIARSINYIEHLRQEENLITVRTFFGRKHVLG